MTTSLQRIDAIHLGAKHRHERGKNVRVARCAARAENAFRFVDEKERHETFAPFLARGGENFAHHPFRFAHPHVENLRPLHVHEIFAHLLARFFAELFRQIVSGRFADERLAAAGRAVKQKAFRRGVLEVLEKILVQQRQLDRVADRLQRFFLAADFFPRQFRHGVEIIFARFWRAKALPAPCGSSNRRALRRPIFKLESSPARMSAARRPIAFRVRSRRAGDRLPRTSVIFVTGPGRFESEIADDDVGFVDQNARSFFQLRKRNARIDVAIIIGAAHDDVRGVASRGCRETCRCGSRAKSLS